MAFGRLLKELVNSIMGLRDLFVTASLPVLNVLLVTAVGSISATSRVAILGEIARKNLNNVSNEFGFLFFLTSLINALIRYFVGCLLRIQSSSQCSKLSTDNYARENAFIVSSVFFFFLIVCSVNDEEFEKDDFFLITLLTGGLCL